MPIAAIIGVGALLAILFIFRDNIAGALEGDEQTEAEKQAETAKQMDRDRKGAFGNTIDFLFGEGTVDSLRDHTNKNSKVDGDPAPMPDPSATLQQDTQQATNSRDNRRFGGRRNG